MLEAKASGSTESKPSQTLLTFKPRQVVLAAHNTKATQMKKQNSKALTSQQEVTLLHSVLCYLESRGFRKALKRLLSEAQIENDGWKTCLPKLEDVYGDHIERRTSVDTVTAASKEQDDAAMKKKKSNESDAISQSVVENSSIKSSKAPSDGTVLEQLADDFKLKKDKKKRKTKSIPEAVESNTGHVKIELQSQVDGKPKDKKKKKGSSESSVKTTEQCKVAPEPISEIPLVEKKSKTKEKKRNKEGSDSKALTGRVAEISREDGPTKEEILEDAVDEQKKVSKKRKRLESDEKDGKPVEELATDELKRRKTKSTEETKSIEKLGHENELSKESEGQNGHVQNESKSISQEPGVNSNDAQQKVKYQRNGSTEPRTVNAFQRVKVEEVEFVDERLQDNSYWAKDGAEIGYGAKAQEVLGQVRGRDFRHEKTKKKRGSYRGGQIDLHSHSVKFNYDDED